MRKLIAGIDEVGRGPLAGPLVLGLVMMPKRFLKILKGIRDSKKLSAKRRKEWFTRLNFFKNTKFWRARKSKIKSFTTSINNKIIDRLGLTEATKIAVSRLLKKARVGLKTKIYLDGGLKAPKKYINQKTVIKGDEKIPIIAAASIVAKVMRDGKMRKFGEKFPKYGFETHKGYGTKFHLKRIRKFGVSSLHRRSFLKSIKKGAAKKIEE